MPKIGVTQVKSHKRLCPEFMVSLFETGFWFSRDQEFLGGNRPLDYFVSPSKCSYECPVGLYYACMTVSSLSVYRSTCFWRVWFTVCYSLDGIGKIWWRHPASETSPSLMNPFYSLYNFYRMFSLSKVELNYLWYFSAHAEQSLFYALEPKMHFCTGYKPTAITLSVRPYMCMYMYNNSFATLFVSSFSPRMESKPQRIRACTLSQRVSWDLESGKRGDVKKVVVLGGCRWGLGSCGQTTNFCSGIFFSS